MAGKSRVYTFRLREHEEKMVEQFLAANPLFDFSTLCRLSIAQFIENPTDRLKKQAAYQAKLSTNSLSSFSASDQQALAAGVTPVSIATIGTTTTEAQPAEVVAPTAEVAQG